MELGRRFRLVIAELGWPSLIALGLAAVVGIAGWTILILDTEPAWNDYTAIYLGAVLLANTLVSSLLFLSPFAKTEEKGTRMTLLVILAPVLLTFVVTTVITPSSIPMEGFLEDIPLVGVTAVIGLLGVAATLGGLLGYFFVVFPVTLLVRALRPTTSRTASSTLYEGLGRRQLIALAIAVLDIVALALFMAGVSDEGGTRAQRRHADLLELVTLTGSPGAIAGVLISLVVLVSAIIVTLRQPRAAA